MRHARSLTFLVGWLIGCGAPAPQKILEPPPPGVRATPRWLTFTCVEPGCETTLTANVEVVGNRDIAIKRIVLSDRERSDVTFVPSREPPFVLRAGESLGIDVTYTPTGDPRLADVAVEVAYTDASATESEDRIEPGTLQIPVVRRLVGEPKLEVEPAELVFGPVTAGAARTLPLKVKNAGFGNVGMVIAPIDTSAASELTVTNYPPAALLPGESWDLEITYRPRAESYLEALLTVRAEGTTEFPSIVRALGTSISGPSLLVKPAEGVDFGEVAVGESATGALELANRGTEPLSVSGLTLGGAVPSGALTVALAGASGTETSTTLAPLASAAVALRLNAQSAGELNSLVRISSNDRQRPVLEVPVTGLITKPEVEIQPASIDFGAVPRGWSVVRRIEVRNRGYGDLVINGVTMVLGSASLFTLRSVPSLPARLRHDQRLALEVEFRSEAEASFAGTLAIESNDAETRFIEIPLAAQGASCERGCPIANGTASCAGGACAVGRCNAGFFDTDGRPTNGCECREIGNDPGAFCADSSWMGSISDDGSSASFTGLLAQSEDVDVLRFFASDGFTLFGESFDVKVRLESADPSLRLCVYRHNTGSHATECVFENESCPGDRSFRHRGGAGPNDSGDYIVRVFRAEGAAPTCTPYTVFVRNG